VLHLGAARFSVTGPIKYTMTVEDALDLCRRVRPRTAIPVHYEGWSHFREGRAAIEDTVARTPEPERARFVLLTLGEATTVEV
jgi:L-ascorbate metabolism protein UlaG (beta-lactamase superfamily)